MKWHEYLTMDRKPKKWFLCRWSIGDKLIDTKDVLVVAYHTLKQGGEGVVDVAPMMNFHLSFLFNQLFWLNIPLFSFAQEKARVILYSVPIFHSL